MSKMGCKRAVGPNIYSVYGLGVSCNASIASLAGLREPAQVDARILLREMPAEIACPRAGSEVEYFRSIESDPHGRPGVIYTRLLDESCYRVTYADGTVIAIDNGGGQVWATWPEPATVEDTAAYLLGPTLGYLLRLRGVTCLHGSALGVGGNAVALVGPSGAGKSSTAAAFAKLGYPILTDDVTALADQATGFSVQPAYPRVRLWPEAVASIFGAPDALPRITPTWEKCFLDLNEAPYSFQHEPLPLAAIYFLDVRSDQPDAPRIEEISQRSALMTLVADTYAANLLDSSMRAREFEVLARLVSQVRLRRVIPNTDATRISEMCELIVSDFAALARTES